MLDVLARVDLFKGLPLDGLARLVALGQRRSFPAGSQLMRQGDVSEFMYVIIKGRVLVKRFHETLPDSLLLAELGPGEVVGEMALLDREPRSATVTAIEDTETVEISATALALTALEFPEVGAVLLKTLSRRLRSTDELAERILQVEAALRESEQRFRAVFDSAGVGMAVLDARGRPLRSNLALQQMVGYSHDELQSIVLTQATHPDDRRDEWDLFQAVLSGERSHYHLEKRCHHKNGALLWVHQSVSFARAADGASGFAIGIVEDITARVQQRQRQETLLRVARHFAAQANLEQILVDLLREAVTLVEGTAAIVYRWDEAEGRLVALHHSLSTAGDLPPIPPGIEALARGIEPWMAIIVNDYQSAHDAQSYPAQADIQAAVAVPLALDGQLLGTLTVVSTDQHKRFTQEDAETLELLGGIASAALIGREGARLGGVLLAARTAEHELNNQLARTVGFAELLARHPDLPEELRAFASEALDGACTAAATVQRFRRITRLAERGWSEPDDSTIDLDRSTG